MAADKTFEAYESIAEESLALVTTQPVQHLIGGERRSSLDGSTFENMSPVDGRPLGTIASASAADIDSAAQAAAIRFRSSISWHCSKADFLPRYLSDRSSS